MQQQMRGNKSPSSSSDNETEKEEKEDPFVPEDRAEAIAERPEERNAGLEEEEKIERRESIITASDVGGGDEQGQFAPIRTSNTRNTATEPYYNNSPFDLDRVNTRESFKVVGRSRATSRASSRSRK